MNADLETELVETAEQRRKRREVFRRSMRVVALVGEIEWVISGRGDWKRGVEMAEEAMAQGAELLRMLKSEMLRVEWEDAKREGE